jgi:hypothetical protein
MFELVNENVKKEFENEETDCLRKLYFAKRRRNLRWVFAMILIISIGAFVTNYFEYRLASGGLDFISHGPHFAANKDQEEQAFGDFQVDRERAVRGMEQHSALVLVALIGVWCVPRKDGRELTKSDRPKDD